jgi:16S rRNA processing protein RimM
MTDEGWDDFAVVGRIARTQGHRGDVIVNPDTDFVETRFRPGAEFFVRRNGRVERMRVVTMRMHIGRPVLGIEGIGSMTEAEALAGLELRVPTAELEALPDGVFYRHDLVGCRVDTVGGASVGVVTAVEGELAASRLVIAGEGGEILMPLVQPMCPVIDVKARRIVVAPPPGLLEVNRRT